MSKEPMDQRTFLLAGMVTAYSLLMDEALTESQYGTREEDTDRVTLLSSKMDQAAERIRELDRQDEQQQG